MNVFGNGKDLMSGLRFRQMSFFFAIRDLVAPHDWKLDLFGIRKGDTVVDYGCGTGSCLRKASDAVGVRGTVYAVDIHDVAIDAAKRVIKKYSLQNVHPVKAEGFSVPLESGTADRVYALDMFHMVSDPGAFLKELRRIIRQDGTIIIEDGHQPRSLSKVKILNSGVWKIIEETREWMVCVPV